MDENIFGRQGIASALLVGVQALVPAVITVTSLWLLAFSDELHEDTMYVSMMVVAGVLALLLLQPRRLSSAQISVDRASLSLSTVGRWAILLGVILAIGYATKSSSHYSRKLVFIWAVVTPFILVAVELFLHEIRRGLSSGGLDRRHVVFVGCNEASVALAERMVENPELKLVSQGFFDDRSADRLSIPEGSTLLGGLPALAPYVRTHGIDMIFISLPMRHIQRVVDLLADLRDTTASIYYVPDIFVYDLIQAKTAQIGGVPVVSMCETPFYGYRGLTKRVSDLALGTLALLLLSPVMLAIAIAILMTSGGPVLFRQKRYGLDGAQISVYKFRSMTVAEDGSSIAQATRNDRRVTRLGRFLRRSSLDELPQLFNVLQGRMSLVGPRPHAVAHNEEYRRLISGYMIRHKVRPGMTGLAQVNGCRGETARLEDMQERVKYDLDYLRRWSPALDIEILWRTFLMLFRRDDKAY